MAENVTTGIDTFIKYLADNGETEMDAVSAAIKVPQGTIREWASRLEKVKFVTISNRMGKTYFSLSSGAV